jgi:hypothetical protein
MMAPAVMISVAGLEAVPRMAEELGAAPAVAPAAPAPVAPAPVPWTVDGHSPPPWANAEPAGVLSPPPWNSEPPPADGLRLSFGTPDEQPTTFLMTLDGASASFAPPEPFVGNTAAPMEYSPTTIPRHVHDGDAPEPEIQDEHDKHKDVDAIRKLLLQRDTKAWLDNGPTCGRVPVSTNCAAALGRDCTQEGLGRIGGRLAGHVGDNRYVADITRDGRSKCQAKGCRKQLVKGEYRLGKRPPSVRYGHSPKCRWYHVDCCFAAFASVAKKSKTITSLDDIERVRAIFPPVQLAHIQDLIDAHNRRLSDGEAGEAPPRKRRAAAPGLPLSPIHRHTAHFLPLVPGPAAGLPRPIPDRAASATPSRTHALSIETPSRTPTFDLEPISTPSAYMMPIHEAGLDLFACPTPVQDGCPTPTPTLESL